MTHAEAARIAGVDRSIITKRVKMGFTLEQAISLGRVGRGRNLPSLRRMRPQRLALYGAWK